MFTSRFLLIKMKKCYSVLFVSFLLTTMIYLLPRHNKDNLESLEDAVLSRLPNDRVHIFYDAGFRNEKIDGKYRQWNYNDIDVNKRIVSAFYPALGLYSSNDPRVIDVHMRQIRNAGIGVVVVHWWPETFENAPPMPLIFKYAERYGLKVTIQIQKYKNRDPSSLRKHLYYFFKKYRTHPAFYTVKFGKKIKEMPMIYIYDSTSTSTYYWNSFLGYSQNGSVRGTELDAIYLGFLVDDTHQYLILNADFDGFYTYHAVHNLTYGSNWYNWPLIQDFAKTRGAIFVPTVSPGFNDRSNSLDGSHTKFYANRQYGAYYMRSWMRGVISRSVFISINSFNGWQEGTQIEPAQPKTTVYQNKKFHYCDYEPEKPEYYLGATRAWIIEFINRSIIRGYY